MFLRRGVDNDLPVQVQSSLKDIMFNMQMLLPVQSHRIETQVIAGDPGHRYIQIYLQFMVPGRVHEQLLVHLQRHVRIEFEHDQQHNQQGRSDGDWNEGEA